MARRVVKKELQKELIKLKSEEEELSFIKEKSFSSSEKFDIFFLKIKLNLKG